MVRDCTEMTNNKKSKNVNVTFSLQAAKKSNKITKYYDIIFNSGSQVNVVHPRFLHKSKREVSRDC